MDQFFNSFIKNIIKCPSSDFYTERYHLEVRIEQSGLCKLRGAIWPLKFQKMNSINLDPSLSEEDEKLIKADFLNLLEKNVSTSSCGISLKNKYSLTDDETQKLLRKVNEHQVHVCLDCQDCQDVPLPSLETFIPKSGEETVNIASCMRLIEEFKSFLLSLTVEEIRTLSTIEWIEAIWENKVHSHELIEPDLWEIEMEDKTFTFVLEEKLNNLITENPHCPLIAAYQFSLMMSPSQPKSRVVLKKPRLIETFTSPFTPMFLKAAIGPVKLNLMRTPADWNALNTRNFSPFERGDTGLIGHEEISLTEALCLGDNMKLRVKTSTSVEFVNTGPKPKSVFKKIKSRTDDCYQALNENTFYQILENYVSRYFKRINGQDLMLSEFIVFFEFCGEEESEHLYQVYQDKLDLIEVSEKCSAVSKDPIPEYILLSNKNVMKKKKQPKVLQYPEFDQESYEYRFSQVLLFSSIESFESLTEAKVEEKFNEVSGDGVSRIKINRRKFLMNVRDIS